MSGNLRRSFKLALLLNAVIALLANVAGAQQQPAPKEDGSANVISGRISSSDSQPLTNARVSVSKVSTVGVIGQYLKIDSNGDFQSPPLEPGLYVLSVIAPGLIRETTTPASNYLRPGDKVNVKMVKGGVITGTVKNSNGDELVAISVRAFRVKTPNGDPIPVAFGSREVLTDDRGMYRIYGLLAGTYIVSAGGLSRAFGAVMPTAYEAFVPTYAPSATRDTAMEIQVTNGNESPADIQFREDRGHVISGAVTGTTTTEAVQQYSANVVVFDVHSRIEVASASALSSSNYAFAVYGVPDGDYEVYASQGSITDQKTSSPTRIKVQGADVTGLHLALAPLASMEGQVTFEDDPNSECGKHRANAFAETMISARRYEPRPPARDAPPSDVPTSARSGGRVLPVDARGFFSFKNLQPGTYQIDPAPPPASGWYLRSITLGRNSLANVSRDGLNLKRGDHVNGLVVTFAEGAAKFKGHLSVGEGQVLPSKLRVYLVPAEREAADNLLRFYEAAADTDGSFTLDNLAPGKYLIVARRAEERDRGLIKLVRQDEALRTAVLKEAAALQKALTVKPCAQINDFDLPYVAPR
jgi:protocatechuate 3,4-dioxygenase beta subunit